MKPRTIICGVAVVACLAFALPQDSRQDESARKVDSLARALELEKRRTNELERRLERIDAWFRTMRSAAEIMNASGARRAR